MKKFDYVIGNPPYQEPKEGTSDAPIYNSFFDAAFEIADKVEMISPARFLFNAGKTPKEWNEKMLSDRHFKIMYYEQDSSKVFSNTDIKGGVAISYRDAKNDYGAIEVFSHFEELRSIRQKITPFVRKECLSDIMILQNRFNLDVLLKDHPEYTSDPDPKKWLIGSNGREKRIVTSAFDKLSVFHDSKESENDIQIFGIKGSNNRQIKWIDKKYVQDNGNFYCYKVLVPKTNGSGAIGEVLSTPLIGTPLIGYTQSFIGIGSYNNENDAQACIKYLKTKFSRTLLGVLKITQDNPPEKWKYVPLQDFTDKSDIDWAGKSVAEIDQQLYKKYGLSEKEIAFIETHVKEMR